jgi:hypothetical protein
MTAKPVPGQTHKSADTELTYLGSTLPAIVFHGNYWSVNWAENGKLLQKKFPNTIHARTETEAFLKELQEVRVLAS